MMQNDQITGRMTLNGISVVLVVCVAEPNSSGTNQQCHDYRVNSLNRI